MELHQALKHIIKAEGQDIVTDLRIINILNDLNAYQDIQGSKYILRAIIDDGFAVRFRQIGSLNSQAQSMIKKFADITGFNEYSVTRIFHSLAYGLGWINTMPKTPNPNPNPIPNPSPMPGNTPTPQQTPASNLNLTFKQLSRKSDDFKRKYAKDAEDYLDSITTILGNPKLSLSTALSTNVSFNASYNFFIINLEFTGGIKCMFDDNITFYIILKSTTGKVQSYAELYLDDKDARQNYFVTNVRFSEDEFHCVCDIAEIKIYWRKD